MTALVDVIVRLGQVDGMEHGAGATPTVIERAESTLGVAFPPELREYLSRLGWLTAEDLEVNGLGDDVPAHLDLVSVTLDERSAFQPSLAEHLVPLANDGAGNLYCLDTFDGKIVFRDHESLDEPEPEVVAPSLGSWLYDEVSTM